MISRVLLTASLLAFSITAIAETPNIEPGMWEYHNKMTFETDFPIPDQEHTNQECVTLEDIEAGDAFMDLDDVDECEITNKNIRRDGADIQMVCNSPDGSGGTMDMSFDFHGDASSGVIRSKMNTPMGEMSMRVEMEGRRIGDC